MTSNRPAEHTPQLLPTFYLDVDGVIAQWCRGVADLLDLPVSSVTQWDGQAHFFARRDGIPLQEARRRMWAVIDRQGPEWWRDLRVHPTGTALYHDCWAAAPTVFVTSPSLSPACAAGKMMFFQKHNNAFKALRTRSWYFGGKKVPEPHRTVTIAATKAALAGKYKILIDDREQNVEDFRAAGGQAFLWPQPWNRAGQGVTDILERRSLQEETKRKAIECAQAMWREIG